MENEIKNEVIKETGTSTNFSPEDYKIVVNMIKEVDESYNTLRQSAISTLTSYGLHESVLEAVLPYEKDKLDNVDTETMRKVLTENSLEGGFAINNVSDENVREIFANVKNESILLISTKMETEKIKAESSDVLKDYFTYISSDRVKKSREARLNALKEALSKESHDSPQYNTINKMINTIESSLNFSFVKERFEKFGEIETQSIEEGFFKDKKGMYILDRFNSKIKKFGYNPEVIRSFYNIEENFLTKEYSPLNNLFLYWYIRFVAYSDPYSKDDLIMVQSITSAMANLIYHKFESIESEQFFISIVRDVDSYFMKDVEVFKENNSSYEGHHDRIVAKEEHDKHRKEALIKSLHRLNVTDFDESMDIDDLQKLYSETAEKLIDAQIPKKEDKTSEESSKVVADETEEALRNESDSDSSDNTNDNDSAEKDASSNEESNK